MVLANTLIVTSMVKLAPCTTTFSKELVTELVYLLNVANFPTIAKLLGSKRVRSLQSYKGAAREVTAFMVVRDSRACLPQCQWYLCF